MALSATRLKDAEKAKILTKLQSLFPIDGDLKAAEKTSIESAQDKMAQAMAEGALETIPEITSNALVNTLVVGVTPGPATTTGSGAVT